MQDHHLHPVPPAAVDTEGGSPSSADTNDGGRSAPNRSQTRPRPKKALPTDRMKLDAQKKALSIIAILSDYGKQGVGSAEMAPRLGLAPTTAGLNNSFFAEAGLIVPDKGKARYKSTEPVNEYARKFSFNAEEAGLSLKEPLSKTWFFKVVRQQLEGMGPTPQEKLVELLAFEAGATSDYRLQLTSLIAWLEFGGLIAVKDGRYVLADNVPPKVDETETTTEEDSEEEDGAKPDPKPEGATTPPQPSDQNQVKSEAILSFSFDFALTKDELAALTPEQIQTLFKAVGEVMAIKASE